MNSYYVNLKQKDAALMLALEMIVRLRDSVQRKCPLEGTGAACACTGACHPQVYWDSFTVTDALQDSLAKIVKPKPPVL